MRITVDRDKGCGILDIVLTLLKAKLYLGWMPDHIERSSGGRGFHYTWHNACKSWEDCLELRYKLGDDHNRIRHDLKAGEPEFRQVLFTNKRVIKHGRKTNRKQ
jgi:hypothetical protein